MRRIVLSMLKLCRGGTALCCMALAMALLPALAAVAADEPGTQIPLKKVVLFSAGVGFFQHDGTVKENAKVEMKFNTRDINDLLMSMVVQDLDGGQVSTVNYASKDPFTKTLKTFAIDLTEKPTLAQILQQVRGEKVELETPSKITGMILGMEKRKKKIDKDEIIEIDVMNLVTDEGLRSIELQGVNSIKLLNPQLNAELQKALNVLATVHSFDKKAVTLNFTGKGERKVRMGYIQEMPLWKTSYRLVLSGEKDALLQGWAIVENSSEQDWKDVNLTLVSGRPISFLMDLYQPLYMPRPMEQLELYASLRPQTYGQDLAGKEADFRQKELVVYQNSSSDASMGRVVGGGTYSGLLGGSGTGVDSAGGGRGGGGPANAFAETRGPAPATPNAPTAAQNAHFSGVEAAGSGALMMAGEKQWSMETLRSIQSIAQAGDVGSLFQYDIKMPVSLPRQESAILPIVNESVEGKKVSIYNQRVQAKHPLCGLEYKNSTQFHLMQGPITVFDENVYAGDARIEDLPPGTKRLISYALDLDTEVATQSKPQPEQMVTVKLIKGTMSIDRRQVRSTEFTVKNSGKKDKTVLIEYPVDPNPDWKLIEPKKPDEKTRDLYRFVVEAKPGEPKKLTVEEERVFNQQVALTNINDSSIRIYLNEKVVSDKVKAALQEIVKRKAELDRLRMDGTELDRRLGAIQNDQDRINKNMAQLDRNTELYKNYVKELSDQEGEIKKIREQKTALVDKQNGLQKSLDDYMMSLDLQ
jgi:hypothetical protein